MQRNTPTSIPITQLRIIVGALFTGLALFAVIAVFVVPGVGAPPESTQDGTVRTPLDVILLSVAALMAFSCLAVAGVLKKVASTRLALRAEEARAELQRDQVPQELVQLTLVRCALGEGVGLLGCVIHLISANSLALAPIGFGLAWLAWHLPSIARFREVVDEARRSHA
jgi:hypothetical protein